MVKDLVRLKSAVHRQQEALQCIAASRDELSAWIKSAEMVMLKGMGAHNFLLLSKAGITDVDKLAQQDAHTLRMSLEHLIANGDENERIPDEAKIRAWIKAAQNIIKA
jgi:cyclopropane fatty-acyl-phospholipid synthase-like methyltransferase